MSGVQPSESAAASVDSGRSGRWWLRRTARVVGWAGVAAAAVGVLTHYVGLESNKLIILSSFVPQLIGVGVVGVCFLALTGSWKSGAVGVGVLALGLFTQAPLFVADTQDYSGYTAGPDLRILQANIRLGEADVDALLAQIRDRSVDVLTVQELTDDAVDRLRAAGVDSILPHQYLDTRESGGGGTGIYSALPLRDTAVLGRFAMANLRAKVDVGEGRTISLVAVHPMPPYPSPAWMWAAEMEKLSVLVHDLGADGDPIVVSGDFNSTYSHSRYRAILTDGFEDAAELTGAGLVLTYPADKMYPAMIGIDHIVVRDVAVSGFERVDLPGSDHHGLFATLTPQFASEPR
ncbi:endonuclease/exonuclease/phosphatase (EEP) superfamily protein YafD [Rhodococcus sp. 27YEA15]|uniref:endonuclease/exonuclease/phosphatase family protein n=1 Tax=Rhodococcus sp. 27YEA15 TaxID=3156259 RepID=UPI003C7CAA09